MPALPRPGVQRRPAGRLGPAAVIVLAAVLAAGCSGSESVGASPPGSATGSARLSAAASGGAGSATPAAQSPLTGPDVKTGCTQARKAILDGTGAFTNEWNAAVSAGEQGQTAQQARHLQLLREALARWAAQLDAVAGRTTTARLTAVLREYAGAVRAALARVHSPADLEKLSTFDDMELDTAADQFARAC